ncbi:hypothetical protein pb186bvf_003736 [Paramecium bursaria]
MIQLLYEYRASCKVTQSVAQTNIVITFAIIILTSYRIYVQSLNDYDD